MGASAWEYRVPYTDDLPAALDALKRHAFATGDYLWDTKDLPVPEPLEALYTDPDPAIWEEGLHSILDMWGVVPASTDPSSEAAFGMVRPVTAAELSGLGLTHPTAADLPALRALATGHSQGRCAVLHDAQGAPAELFIFGRSGD